MFMYTLEHKVSLSYRTTWWMFTKLDRDEVLIVTHLCIGFSANSFQGWIQGRAICQKYVNKGFPFQRTSSSDRKATATNRIYGSDLKAYGKKRYYFWFHSEVKFLTRLWCPFGLSHFGVFYCNFYRFVRKKVLYLHSFLCIVHVYKWENAYKRFIICQKNFNEFFKCIYFSEGRVRGGGH